MTNGPVNSVVVDGVTHYRRRDFGSQWYRPLMEILDDHPEPVCAPDDPKSMCQGCVDCPVPCCADGAMVWEKGWPIVRFTAEGLQVEECVRS